MANPKKQCLSRTLTDMKFMKRRSGGNTNDDTSGALIDKWYAPSVPNLKNRAKWPEVDDSYVDFEDLNKLGRFSYNKYNKDTEHLMENYSKIWSEETDLSDGEIEDDDDGETVGVVEVVQRYKQLGMSEGKVLGKRKRY